MQRYFKIHMYIKYKTEQQYTSLHSNCINICTCAYAKITYNELELSKTEQSSELRLEGELKRNHWLAWLDPCITSVTSAYRPWPRLADRTCNLHPIELLFVPRVQTVVGQWTDNLEQSAACTRSTRAVRECLHMCNEDALVLPHPAPMRCFTRFQHQMKMR